MAMLQMHRLFFVCVEVRLHSLFENYQIQYILDVVKSHEIWIPTYLEIDLCSVSITFLTADCCFDRGSNLYIAELVPCLEH